jgi:hypothetical protein
MIGLLVTMILISIAAILLEVIDWRFDRKLRKLRDERERLLREYSEWRRR